MNIFPNPSDKDLLFSIQDRLLAGGNGWLAHIPIPFSAYEKFYPQTAKQIYLDKRNKIIYSDFISSIISGDSFFPRKINYLESGLKKIAQKFQLSWINIFYDISSNSMIGISDEKNYLVSKNDYQSMLIDELNKNLPDIVFVYGKSPFLENFVCKLIRYNDYPLYFSINIL